MEILHTAIAILAAILLIIRFKVDPVISLVPSSIRSWRTTWTRWKSTQSPAASAGATSKVKVNDETWLQVNDAGVHDRFAENFADVSAAAHTCWQTSKEEGCGGGRGPDAPGPDLNCHETADKYEGAGWLYFYDGTYCKGANDAKAEGTDDPGHGDTAGPVQGFDNQTDSLVNTTEDTIEFYNYPTYNAGHDGGDRFCVRPGQWVNQLSRYGDGHNSWSSSMSSHRVVDPGDCDRWFGGYHEPNR